MQVGGLGEDLLLAAVGIATADHTSHAHRRPAGALSREGRVVLQRLLFGIDLLRHRDYIGRQGTGVLPKTRISGLRSAGRVCVRAMSANLREFTERLTAI